MTNSVTIVEVGPRDGLQNESATIPLAEKVAFIDGLAEAGLTVVEAGAFVSPKAVPQMADSDDVFLQISRRPGVRYLALTPNERGFDRALQAKADGIGLFASATEAFSLANLRCSVAESFARFVPVIARARAHDVPIRSYLSVAFVCPFSGVVETESALRTAVALHDLGSDDLCLADTIGRATPDQVEALILALSQVIPVGKISLHVHDTGGRALENIDVALELGIRTIDSAAGGLGGCPFAPGAPGNVATETVVRHLESHGFTTGVDVGKIENAYAAIRPRLGRAATEAGATP